MLGHAESKTTQIYSHYAPSAREVDMINEAFTKPADRCSGLFTLVTKVA
ncbi:MAG: hypothetical protein QOK49_2175 [Baekduia sp.]|jgi:hypothetical protein|nr:hypothetical protein [Pseudonocardiales bacterium]MDX6727370.1 hypothetical protein [Baekduia sp.]MEA2481031.1 hypothetical protein [Thermoleophilaceae bacterium]